MAARLNFLADFVPQKRGKKEKKVKQLQGKSYFFFLVHVCLAAGCNETYAKNGGDSCRRASFDAVAKFYIVELGYETRGPRGEIIAGRNRETDKIHYCRSAG